MVSVCSYDLFGWLFGMLGVRRLVLASHQVRGGVYAPYPMNGNETSSAVGQLGSRCASRKWVSCAIYSFPALIGVYVMWSCLISSLSQSVFADFI